jgi:hypothetical protein
MSQKSRGAGGGGGTNQGRRGGVREVGEKGWVAREGEQYEEKSEREWVRGGG